MNSVNPRGAGRLVTRWIHISGTAYKHGRALESGPKMEKLRIWLPYSNTRAFWAKPAVS